MHCLLYCLLNSLLWVGWGLQIEFPIVLPIEFPIVSPIEFPIVLPIELPIELPIGIAYWPLLFRCGITAPCYSGVDGPDNGGSPGGDATDNGGRGPYWALRKKSKLQTICKDATPPPGFFPSSTLAQLCPSECKGANTIGNTIGNTIK